MQNFFITGFPHEKDENQPSTCQKKVLPIKDHCGSFVDISFAGLRVLMKWFLLRSNFDFNLNAFLCLSLPASEPEHHLSLVSLLHRPWCGASHTAGVHGLLI